MVRYTKEKRSHPSRIISGNIKVTAVLSKTTAKEKSHKARCAAKKIRRHTVICCGNSGDKRGKVPSCGTEDIRFGHEEALRKEWDAAGEVRGERKMIKGTNIQEKSG